MFSLRKNSSSITRTTGGWAPFSGDFAKRAPPTPSDERLARWMILFFWSRRRPAFRAAKAPNLIQPYRDSTVPYHDPFISSPDFNGYWRSKYLTMAHRLQRPSGAGG